MDLLTKTVELKIGIKDENGKVQKSVTLTEPLIEHEIRRDNIITRLRMSDDEEDNVLAESDAFQILALVRECCTSFGTLLAPTVDHFRKLRRAEAKQLIKAFADLQTGEVKGE